MDAQTVKNGEPNFWQSHLREAFRLTGSPARLVRANLFVIWILILFDYEISEGVSSSKAFDIFFVPFRSEKSPPR